MSADSFHKLVEDKMKHPTKKEAESNPSKGCVYDFDDYKGVMQDAGGQVHEMKPSLFIDIPTTLSTGKWTHYPLLETITMLQFRQGSTKMFWKCSFDDADFQQGEFMQRCYLNCHTQFTTKQKPRRLDPQKLSDIQKKLCKFMPEEKRSFWQTMPSNPNSDDLCKHYDDKLNASE